MNKLLMLSIAVFQWNVQIQYILDRGTYISVEVWPLPMRILADSLEHL